VKNITRQEETFSVMHVCYQLTRRDKWRREFYIANCNFRILCL